MSFGDFVFLINRYYVIMETPFTISNGILTFLEGTEVIDLTSLEKTELVEKIIIPATATRMCCLPTIPLHDLPNLKYIVVEEGNPVFDSRDDCNAVIETKTNTLLMGCANTVIPSTVVTIFDDAFSSCDALKVVNLPENVTTINPTAYSYCSGLRSLSIPKTVLLVDHWAFEGCNNLETVWFNGEDTKLGEDVFRYCHKLDAIYVPKGTEEKYKMQLAEEFQDIVYSI